MSRRWASDRVYEFPQWVRNDVDKYRDRPGFNGVAERALLAADLLDAVIATHAGCQIEVCPTWQAIERVLSGSEEGKQ